MTAITCPIIITRVSTKSDGSLSVGFTTPELTPEEKLPFLELQNRNCKILIQPDAESAAVLKEIKGELDKKTASQRLRGVLFCLWKHLCATNKCEISFESWYAKKMDAMIETLKDELPDRPF